MDNRLQTILFRAGWTAICLLAFLGVQAQTTPQFYNSSSGTSYNSFPLNSATNQVQWIYGPGEFNSTGPTGTPAYYGLITKVYFRLGTTAGATTYTNFSISLGQNVGTQSTWGTSSGSGYAFTTGLTPVFTQASYTMTGATSLGWYGITLPTPFLYDPALGLVFELKVQSGTGNQVAQVSTTGLMKRIYAAYGATTGTNNTGLVNFGFDLMPAGPCTAPPIAGTTTIDNHTPCFGQSIQLGLNGNSNGTGQTFHWESASNIAGPFTAITSPAATSGATVTASAAGVTYFQAAVTCSGQTTYSSIDSIVVPTPFAGGTYTIDSATPTGGTNFQSFTDAMAAMGCGIAGPVVLNVVPGSGPYNEQITLPATIGTTATNTLTINGNGDTLRHDGTGTGYATLRLDGADFVTVNNLVIQTTGVTNGFAVHLGNGADSNTFDSCTFIASTTATGTTSAGVVMSGSPTSYSTGGANGNGNTFSNSTVTGGYFGFVFYGSSTSGNSGNSIINCTAQDYHIYGSYNLQQGNLTVANSVFERPTRTALSTFYGVMLSTGCANALIEKNIIRHSANGSPGTSLTAYGIYCSAASSSGNENKLHNNVIYNLNNNGSTYGLYLTGATHIQAYHNTVALDYAAATTGTVYGIYATGTAGVNLQNNNISITRGGSGTKYCLYFSGAGKTSNYNNLYIVPSATNNVGFLSTAFNTLANWQTANSNAFDQNSVSVDPMFANAAAGNLAPGNSLLDDLGTPLGITTDILGAPRSLTTPDIGAYEFAVPPCVSTPVAGIASVVGNITSACQGTPINLSLNGFTIASGITIQWEESPSGTAIWTPIAGATSSTATAILNGPTDYRAIVTCTNGGGNDQSNTVSIGISPFYLCYCSPLTGVTLHTSTANYITNVNITNTTLNVSTTTVGGGGYTQHNYLTPSNTATLTQGQTYSLNATISNAAYQTEVWFDWDQSGTFDTSEYMLLPASTSPSLSVTIPITAIPGLTGMRLRNQASTTTLHGPGGACSAISVGRETEDFVITIAQGIPCAGIPGSTGTVSATMDTLCNGGSTTLDLTGYPTDLGLTFQWESSPAGQNTFSAIGGATGYSYTATGLTSSMEYRVAVTCTNPGGGTANSASQLVHITNPQILSTTPGTRCGTGTVQLSAAAGAGNIVNWYASATGGAPLASNSTSFTTPSISGTTTFYAAAATPGAGSATAPLPAHGSNYTGNVRGYYFTAPVNFTITGLEALAQTTGNQSLAVVKFNNNTPPPIYSATTNAFTVLYLTQNNPATGMIPVNIPINAGEVIGILGQIGNASSYATPTGPYVTTIAGQPVTLTRMGMQFALGTTAPQDLWEETNGAIGRVAITYSDACEGSRVPVTATVTAPPTYTVSATPDTVCAGGSSTVAVSSANAYTYSWTPSGTGSSFSVSPTSNTTYYVTGIDANNCGIYDSVTVHVKSVPATVATVAASPAICVSGNADLSLNPVPMSGIGIQWQKNTGSGFTDIPGANGATLLDPVTTNTDYQAKLFCNGSLVATSTPVTISYSNPTVAQTFPGSRCGPGPVTLAATGSPAGTTLKWYAAPTGGTSLGSGNAFTTPNISSTTTYYIEPIGGGGGNGSVGPVSPQSVGGGGGTSAAITTYHMAFDVLAPTTLLSVDVYPVAAVGSNGAITIQDAASNTLITVPYTTTVTGGATPQTIPINLPLSVGTGYKMGQSPAISLFRNTAGAVYPYTSSAINIVSNNFSATYYYYFYNWQFSSGCVGPRVPITATVNGTPSGTGLATGGTTTGTNHADGAVVSYTDACNDTVAVVNDAAGGNVLGNTSAIVLTAPTVQTYAGIPYVPRVFDIQPASSGAATVTLYALQSEFNAYNTYVTSNSLGLPLLPTGPSDITGIGNIVITQYHGAASAGTQGPGGLYSTANVEFIPNSAITASSNGTYWTLTFQVTGFSGFFIHTGANPLHIDLKNISAVNIGSRNRVDWTTGSEMAGDRFELERSGDGRSFIRLASIDAKGTPSSYSYWDEEPYTGVNYYRLRMLDAAGKATYSKVVSALVKAGKFLVEAYPNPVSDQLTVKAYGTQGKDATVIVTDVTGKLVKTVTMEADQVQIDMKGLAQGMYLIKYADSEHSQTIKVNKQ